MGIDTDDSLTGYKKITIRPHVGGGLTQANASLITNYGKLSAGWKTEGATLKMDVVIPANSRAKIYLPATGAGEITENGAAVNSVQGIQVLGKEGDYIVIETGSGEYHFLVK